LAIVAAKFWSRVASGLHAGTDAEITSGPILQIFFLDTLAPQQRVELFTLVRAGDYFEDMKAFWCLLIFSASASLLMACGSSFWLATNSLIFIIVGMLKGQNILPAAFKKITDFRPAFQSAARFLPYLA